MNTPHAVPAMVSTPIPDASSRHLVLIDAENMAGTPSPATLDVVWLKAALRLVIPDLEASQHIVACSHHAARVLAFAFPAARHLWRSGENGADHALLDVLENEYVDQRFGRVTLCSGDGIFAACVAWLGGADIDVTVIAQEGRLARRLELAARRTILLPNTEWLFGTGDAS